MKSWQERGRPYDGYPYSATTPHYLWDGGTHYWTGMPVISHDGDTSKPECCQDLSVYERVPVTVVKAELKAIRDGLAAKGITHEAAAAQLGCNVSTLRSRLYGNLPMPKNFYTAIRQFTGLDAVKQRDAKSERKAATNCGRCGESLASRKGNYKYCAVCGPIVEAERNKIHRENFKRKRRGQG